MSSAKEPSLHAPHSRPIHSRIEIRGDGHLRNTVEGRRLSCTYLSIPPVLPWGLAQDAEDHSPRTYKVVPYLQGSAASPDDT